MFLLLFNLAFAGNCNIDVGIGYQYAKGKFAEKNYIIPNKNWYATQMIGFFSGFEYENDYHQIIYGNIGVGFSDQLKFNSQNIPYDWTLFTREEDAKETPIYSGNFGVGYALEYNQMRFLIGAGMHVDHAKFESPVINLQYTNFGANLYVKGTVKFSEHLGGTVSFFPNLNVYNAYKISLKGQNEEEKHSWLQFGFSSNVYAGMTFSL